MAWVWNVIDCENQNRDFVDQSQPDYDITGNTWTNKQTPGTVTQASTSVTRTSRYSASNTIKLYNSVYGDVWGGDFKSTGTERKQSGTPISDFTHKESSVSLKAGGAFSAFTGSDADDVLGFRTVEVANSSIDVAMGGSFKAEGKGAFRVDELLTAENGLSLDGLVNTDILAWFGGNSLSMSVDSSGSSFTASNSDVHDALVGFENVTLSGSLADDSGSTALILGGKTSLSVDVTLKEAVEASAVKFNAGASAALSVKSIGTAGLYATDANAVVGYADLTIADGADVGFALGGNLDVKLSASGKATVVDENDSTVISYAEGSASLSASLKSGGNAVVFGGYTDVGALIGYREVAVSGASAGVILGGNLSVEMKGGSELADLNTEVIENMISDPSLENLTVLLESMQSANLSADISLKSAGQADLTSYTPVYLLSSGESVETYDYTEFFADADAVVGYENFAANQGSHAGWVIGGNLSISLAAKAEGELNARLTAELKSKGQALVQDSETDVLAGYRDLTAVNGDVGVAVGGNLTLTGKGGYALGDILLNPVSVSLASIGGATLTGSRGDALVGYRDVSLTASEITAVVGGSFSGDLNAVISGGFTEISGGLSFQSKADRTLTLAGGSSVSFALGYQDVVIRDSEAGLVIGGILKVDATADYPSPFAVAGTISLASRGQATVSNSSVTLLAGYRDLAVTGGAVDYALGGDISAVLSLSQEDRAAALSFSCASNGRASLTQGAQASLLAGYQTLSLNASGVDIAIGGKVSVNAAGEIDDGNVMSLGVTANLTSQSSATLINGAEAGVLVGYRTLSVNGSTIGGIAIGADISLNGGATLTPVTDSDTVLLDVSVTLSAKSAGTAAITNRSTVGDLAGYRTVAIERNSTIGTILGGDLAGTLSATGVEVNGPDLNNYFADILGGVLGGNFDQPADSPFDGVRDEIVFSGTWKSAGSATVTGGTVDGIYGYSTVTLNYVTVGSAGGGNYTFTGAPLSSLDPGDADTCLVSAGGKLIGTELDIDDITGFKKIEITGGTVSGAVSATSSTAGDLAQRDAVFLVTDVDFSAGSSLSGYGKVVVDGTYNSTMAMVTTTDGGDTFTLQGNAGLYVETLLFGAGNDKLAIRGNSTLYADSMDFGSGKDVLDVASDSQLNFYGSNIEGLEKITGRGTVVVTDEALAEALRRLTSTATIVYNPLLEPAGFAGASLQLESDAAYNLDAGTALDALASATASALFDDERKSSVLGAMIA